MLLVATLTRYRFLGLSSHLIRRSSHAKKIFISYRRAGTVNASGRIYDQLVIRYGKTNVFKDIDSIPFGADSQRYIDETIQQCACMLVLTGRHWMAHDDASGMPRLRGTVNFVRVEIETAHRQGVPILPEALALDPKYAPAWNSKGTMLLYLKSHQEALAAYEQALALDSKFALAWDNKTAVLKLLGRSVEARERNGSET